MERRTIPEGMFDGELYEDELPPGEEQMRDLPPGVQAVSQENALAAEQRFLSNQRREDDRQARKLIDAMKKGEPGQAAPRKTAESGSSKPQRNSDKPIGYSDKAQRAAHRKSRADEGKRNG